MAELVDHEPEMHRSKLSELRAELPEDVNLILEDWKALKFLAARQFHITNAARMATNWAKWWHEPINHLTEWTPREMSERVCVEVEDHKEHVYREHCPHSYLGEDIDGCPIFWEKLGTVAKNLPKVLEHVSHDEIYIRHIRTNERMNRRLKQQSKKHGREITKLVAVLDLKDLPFFPTSDGMKIIRRNITCDEAYYAEGLKTLVIINAPVYFTAIWAVIKPWLDPVTLRKIRICGSGYLDTLLSVIPPENIPVEYGGTKADFAWTYPECFEV